MSLVFIDGFDHYTEGDELYKWDGPYSNAANYDNPTIQTGRDSRGKCVQYPYGRTAKYVPAQDTYIAGFAFKFTGTPSLKSILLIFAWGNRPQVTLRLETSGKLQAYREEISEVALGTPTKTLVAGTWYYVECKAYLHDTYGSVEVHIDGILDSKATDVDTIVDTGAVITEIAVGGGDVGSSWHWFDDLYMLDTGGGRNNDFLGVCRIDTLFPTAAGASTGWTPSTGSNYDCVNEVSATFTDYVSGDAVGEEDLYTFGDMPFTPDTINGVQTTVYAKRGSASFRKIGAVTRVGGTSYVQDERYLSVSPRYYTNLNETQPGGAGLWNKTVVDGAQFGVKVTA